MVTAPIATFDYLERTFTNHKTGTLDVIPWEAIIIGSLKVALVAIIETQVSAVIAQRKYTQKHESTGQKPCEFLIQWEIFGMACANMLSGIMGGTLALEFLSELL
jgi:phosphatidylglycerophosphatase A